MKRHLHWECKGKEGVFGEDGNDSHGEDASSAPNNIKECARKNGFNVAKTADPESCKVPPWLVKVGVGVTVVGAGVACALAEPCGAIVGGGAVLGTLVTQ